MTAGVRNDAVVTIAEDNQSTLDVAYRHAMAGLEAEDASTGTREMGFAVVCALLALSDNVSALRESTDELVRLQRFPGP